MNIKSAVFGFISIKPQSINTVVTRLPYAKDSVYNAIEGMLDRGDLIKTKINGKITLDIPKDYNNQKKKEMFIKSLSYGIDPEILLRKSSLKLWKALDNVDTISSLSKETGLSKKSVGKLLRLFSNYNLISYKKKRPVVVQKEKNHPLNQLLNTIQKPPESLDIVYVPGSSPFQEIVATPDEIENILYNKIDESFIVKKTGFLVRGYDDNISILESTHKKLSIEELFLKKVFTNEGVEENCIQLLASHRMNYEKLLELSIKKDVVNIVGCYLNIVHDLNTLLVPKYILKMFYEHISNKKLLFLKDEKRYGKSGWEDKYENKWNVDLYLDLGSIKHGVRAL